MMHGQFPNVDLDELMERIRSEILRRKADTSVANTASPDSFSIDRPVYNPSAGKWSQVENALFMAKQVSQVGTRLPAMHTFRGWKRKIAQFVGKIYLRVSQVITRDQRAFNESILVAVYSLQEIIKQIESTITMSYEHLKHIDNLRNAMNEIRNWNEEKFSSVISRIENEHLKTENDIYDLRAFINSFESSANKQLSDISLRLSFLHEELSCRSNEINLKIDENTSRFQGEIDNLSLELKKTLQKIDYLKTSLLLQDRRLTLLIEEARRRIPESFSKEQLESFVEKARDYYDPFYFEFEDQFRGSRDDIKERQRIYLPYIREAKAGTEERFVLDLGCGRGEWLELLK
ncbi:MAG: hypothetical protein HPY89_13325, partial [Pelotomaculum sp.]|nr:hypothetical protein [Pelotomaculum sp.]